MKIPLTQIQSMEIAPLSEIKKELKTQQPQDVLELCLRLARFKKENKELLNYLLFERHQEDRYVEQINNEVDEVLSNMNTSGFYLAKKTIRKAHRLINKHIRFSAEKETEVEVRLHFCESLRTLPISIKRSRVMMNLYRNEMHRIEKANAALHEDIQFDYRERIDRASSFQS